MDGQGEPVESHVAELRKRLVYSLGFFALASVAGFYFSARILSWLQQDLGLSLHALTAYEVIYTQILISFLAGFVLSLPFIAWQMLQFARPGLKPREYRALRNFLPLSFLLFVVGAVFSYEVVVSNALEFFQASTASSEVAAVWGLRSTIGFALRFSAVVGLMFQLPIAAAVLARAGLLRAGHMREYRVYFIVAVLIIAALATPPDVITQLLITFPVILLYEASIFLVKRLEWEREP